MFEKDEYFDVIASHEQIRLILNGFLPEWPRYHSVVLPLFK